jgi:hypothetical protein
MQEWAGSAVRPINAADYFNTLWTAAAAYVADYPRVPDPNFEQILGSMMNLAHWETPPPRGNLLRFLIGGRSGLAPDHLQTQLILDQLSHLFGKLARHMRERSAVIEKGAPAFTAYAGVFAGLRDHFDLGVYTLNYDTGLVSALPDAFTGFTSTGFFDPRAVLERREWDFGYHLHGSVHHTLVDGYSTEIRWRHDLAGEFHDGDEVPPSQSMTEFRTFPRTTLIAGGLKLDQLLVDPFQTLYASLIRHVHEADAILIAGYGFGDVHINRALQNRLSQLSARPPVIVVDKTSPTELPMGIREGIGNSLWAWNLTQTLKCSFNPAAGRIDSRSLISILLDEAKFERSMDDKVAIWHGGFETIANSIDKFSARLTGGLAKGVDAMNILQ